MIIQFPNHDALYIFFELQKPMSISTTIKIIQLSDTHVDTSNQYPYIHSIKSKIRLRLRSKIVYDHYPLILIEKLNSFDYLLPLTQSIDLTSQYTQDNFLLLSGQIKQDGDWQAQLPAFPPGVISYQVVFTKKGSNRVNRFGSHDFILLCQDKFELRKLRKMTVFPRCIGRYQKWTEFFQCEHELGYNAFHLAPIQQVGASNSYYSLKCHLELSDYLFDGSREEKNKQLQSVLRPLQQKGMIFFIDIILNHTSFDSEWVRNAPESVFTTQNTPMLYTAFIVDQVIFEWGEQVKEMMSFDVDLTEEILLQIEENLLNRLIHLNLHQYFTLASETFDIMLSLVPTRKPSENIFAKDPIEAILDFLQAACTIAGSQASGVTIKQIEAWMELNLAYEETDLAQAIASFNQQWKNKIQKQWIPQIIKNTIESVRYHYFENSFRTFDDPYPLVNKYFSRIEGVNGQFYAVNNGWVGGADSREIFITSKEFYYLRRKVNAWGDLLRIRYGEKPEDSPVAWQHMLEYVREMAYYFDGFRMDNLHGTQIIVAKHMIKQARKVNPHLIVFAELFTSSQAENAIFVKQIGINSILKEAQHMLSGPEFVGQFHKKIETVKPYLGALSRIFQEGGETIKYSVRKKPIYLVYDLTHDNQTYISKGIHILQTPVSFAISLIGTFIGSTKGYDQFFSKKIEVTEINEIYKFETIYAPQIIKLQVNKHLVRFHGKSQCSLYGSWNQWASPIEMIAHPETESSYAILELPVGRYEYKFKQGNQWILDEKKQSNASNNHQLIIQKQKENRRVFRNLEGLRKETSKYVEKYFEYKEYHVYHIGNIVIIIREKEDHLGSICVIANLSQKQQILTKQINLVGNINFAQFWLQSQLSIYEGLITQSQITASYQISEFFEILTDKTTGYHSLSAPFLPAGFACIFQCEKNSYQTSIIQSMNELIERQIILPPLGALEYNSILFGCSAQQQSNYGKSNYTVPESGYKQLSYAGFAGIYSVILRAKRSNSLSEGIFENMRQGDWLLNYFLQRLKRHKHMSNIVDYLEGIFTVIYSLPRYLIPMYFTEFMYKFMIAMEQQTNYPNDFQRKLAVSANQFINYFPNCPLPYRVLFSAGLPHFAVGWARCWGRDTFTCSDLLLLSPNIFRQTILQFGSALRHGLIPNLLDQGRRPRYNSRDACWWFIRAIAEYIKKTKDFQILKTKINMLFLSSNILEHNKLMNEGKKKVLLLEQVVQDIFQSHANGISFRQWNAGYEIDSNMTTDGFNIALQVDVDTGFIIGGNGSNCLTWMDKMGSSTHAGNKGIPSTPRAGSPVELVGLLYFCLQTFQKLNQQGHYSFSGVDIQGTTIKFEIWSKKIKNNFEYYYYLDQNIKDQSGYIRGIYKDLVGSPLKYDQQRFRPNALIALAISPDLFIPNHARSYIKKIEQHLLSPKSIGVSTLASVHTPYVPYYDNSDDSSNIKTAHGFSYHNGPQWVWLYGFYVVAKMNFEEDQQQRKRSICLLQDHFKHLESSQWLSLPEITNKNGEYNNFSCQAQAWSVSSIIMALNRIKSDKKE